MKKILLITYFFPPSNFAGSYRLASFARYFNKFGYYPVVVTRQAPENAADFRVMAGNCGSDIIFEKNEGFEVYYLPYKANLRDRIYAKYGDNKYVYIRRLLSFFELLLQAVTPFAMPYANLYSFSKNYLKYNNDIKLIIASGKPFQLFLFAYLLSKKYIIPWVADYRDEWNCRYINNNLRINLNEKILFRFESFLERKWTKNLLFAITPTEVWTEHIKNFVGKPCHVVMNGFDPEKIIINDNSKISGSKELNILYLGSLYKYQPIEIFINSIVKLLENNFKIKCVFPGILNEPENEKRILNIVDKFSNNFIIMPRISQKEVYKLMAQADLFLMVGYNEIKGWMSLKVIEYLPWHKPILLCPGNFYMEEFLKNYSLSFVCNSETEVVETLLSIIYKTDKKYEVTSADNVFIDSFKRESQAAKFCEIIDEFLEVK